MTEKIQKLFAANPTRQLVFVTSDGMPFWRFADASAHGRSLKDQKVVAIDPEGNEEEVDVAPNNIARPSSSAMRYEDEAGINANTPANDADDPKPLEEMTVAEVGQWAGKQEELAELNAALELVETKGGKAAIQARIDALTTEKQD